MDAKGLENASSTKKENHCTNNRNNYPPLPPLQSTKDLNSLSVKPDPHNDGKSLSMEQGMKNNDNAKNQPLTPLISANEVDETAQKITKEKNSKRGRRSDPRMNKAVAARLANPNITLLEALQAGGFVFPGLEPNRAGNPSTKDSDNVQLAQRKNQLSRRLRQARAEMTGATDASSDGKVNIKSENGSSNTKSTSESEGACDSSTSSETSKKKKSRKKDKNRKNRKRKREKKRKNEKKKHKKRKDLSDSSSDDDSSSSSSSSESTPNDEDRIKIRRKLSDDHNIMLKDLFGQSQMGQSTQNSASSHASLYLQQLQNNAQQRLSYLPQPVQQLQGITKGPAATAASYINSLPSTVTSSQGSYGMMSGGNLDQHFSSTAPPKKKIKNRSSSSASVGSCASNDVSAASGSFQTNLLSVGNSSLTLSKLNKAGIIPTDTSKFDLSLETSDTKSTDNIATTSAAASLFQDFSISAHPKHAFTTTDDPKMLLALDYYRSESTKLFKRCLLIAGYSNPDTEECDNTYLNFAAKAISDDILRWKRLRSLYLQCQLMNDAAQQQHTATTAAATASSKITNINIAPFKSDASDCRSTGTNSITRGKSMKPSTKMVNRVMASAAMSSCDGDTTSHEESEFTKQLEDIDTVSEISNFDTISDVGSRNSNFSRQFRGGVLLVQGINSGKINKGNAMLPMGTAAARTNLLASSDAVADDVASRTGSIGSRGSKGSKGSKGSRGLPKSILPSNDSSRLSWPSKMNKLDFGNRNGEDKNGIDLKRDDHDIASVHSVGKLQGNDQKASYTSSNSENDKERSQEWNSDLDTGEEQGDKILASLMKLSS